MITPTTKKRKDLQIEDLPNQVFESYAQIKDIKARLPPVKQTYQVK